MRGDPVKYDRGLKYENYKAVYRAGECSGNGI